MPELDNKTDVIKPRLIAIIPARGGSKRLPRKNVRLLGGKPLISWSIASAIDAGLFEEVLVSTDDPEIAAVARDAGALVPWLRPQELATDTATTSDVLRHALTWYESNHGNIDAVTLLQPTSPFRRNASIHGAVQLFLSQPKGNRQTVVSVSSASIHPEWCFHLIDGRLTPVMGWECLGMRSQDLQAAVQVNGSIYIASSEIIRASLPLVVPGTISYVSDAPDEAVDIDTETDWRLAEAYLKLM